MASEISQRILALVADVLECRPSDISADQHLFNDLGASSLDIAEMIWRIEDNDAFGIGEIPDEVLEQISTIQDIIDFIDSRTPLGRPVDVDDDVVGVVLGVDHHGLALADTVVRVIEALGFSVRQIGAEGEEVDFVGVAEAAALQVARGDAEQAILIGFDGVDMALVANRIRGVRAASCPDHLTARLARERHDIQVMCLGAGLIGPRVAAEATRVFLTTPYEADLDGRRERRLQRIREIERS